MVRHGYNGRICSSASIIAFLVYVSYQWCQQCLMCGKNVLVWSLSLLVIDVDIISPVNMYVPSIAHNHHRQVPL